MNIILINHNAGSPYHGMAFRPYYLSREWVRLGHRVMVVAASFSHGRSSQPDIKGPKELDEQIDGIQYKWFRTPDYSGNGVGRVRNIYSFVSQLFIAGKRLAASFKPDIVIASSTYPMDIWPAKRMAKHANAKLVFEVHDLWQQFL